MYNCDEDEIIKFKADFDEDFNEIMIGLIGNCKRLYFLDSNGFGINSIESNSKFNKSVDLLPQNLTHIKFGYSFNQPVDNLPLKLTWLEFGYSFNQYVDMLPNSITYLVFGEKFNKPVNNLPNCIEYISFGFEFNQSIDSLPESIIFIKIGCPSIKTGSTFNTITYNLPKKINNLLLYKSKNKRFTHTIKSNFIEQLNNLIL